MHIWCAPTWRFHTELCKFLRNISKNICGLGERTDLKLGEVPSLFIFNRITISWPYPLNGFRFIFLLRDSENDLYGWLCDWARRYDWIPERAKRLYLVHSGWPTVSRKKIVYQPPLITHVHSNSPDFTLSCHSCLPIWLQPVWSNVWESKRTYKPFDFIWIIYFTP